MSRRFVRLFAVLIVAVAAVFAVPGAAQASPAPPSPGALSLNGFLLNMTGTGWTGQAMYFNSTTSVTVGYWSPVTDAFTANSGPYTVVNWKYILDTNAPSSDGNPWHTTGQGVLSTPYGAAVMAVQDTW